MKLLNHLFEHALHMHRRMDSNRQDYTPYHRQSSPSSFYIDRSHFRVKQNHFRSCQPNLSLFKLNLIQNWKLFASMCERYSQIWVWTWSSTSLNPHRIHFLFIALISLCYRPLTNTIHIYEFIRLIFWVIICVHHLFVLRV